MASCGPIARVPALTSVLFVALAIASSGCASDEPDASAEKPTVKLTDRSRATGNKVLHFAASTSSKLYRAGGPFAIELRGIDTESPKRATFAAPDYADPNRCDLPPCEWTVVPKTASTYEFRAFLINLKTRKTAAQSPPVRAVWAPPPRPDDFKVLINGKNMPLVPLGGGDEYLDTPAGKLVVEARWTRDTRDTGYYVIVSTTGRKERVWATCRAGTSCRVSEKASIAADQEMSWNVKVLTTRGDKLAAGFQVCLVGRA